MDALKARMIQEGYPLADGTPQGNETLWRSLVRGVRRPQLLRLLRMTPEALDARITEIRAQRGKLGKR